MFMLRVDGKFQESRYSDFFMFFLYILFLLAFSKREKEVMVREGQQEGRKGRDKDESPHYFILLYTFHAQYKCKAWPYFK